MHLDAYPLFMAGYVHVLNFLKFLSFKLKEMS